MNFPVNSYNEWDPLEEVIVGDLRNAAIPPWHVTIKASTPRSSWELLQGAGGYPYPKEQVDLAQKDLDGLIHIIESEGISVRRPDPLDYTKPFSSAEWQSASGFSAANPRDVLLVVGDEIIEASMAWRSRYFEVHAYRSLIKEYFQKGARWTAAPKPTMRDELYDESYEVPEKGERLRYAVTEYEPTFDAADFIRCGRDIFVIRSNATNAFGIEWMRRHLGETYRIHEVRGKCTQPLHIDTTFVPLAPGKLLANPDFLDVGALPKMFEKWDILRAPAPVVHKVSGDMCSQMEMSSQWMNMNVLMLDEKRVIVERGQEPMIKALKDWGFEPIPCAFQNYYVFAGSFHCATCDIRRRGELQSYF